MGGPVRTLQQSAAGQPRVNPSLGASDYPHLGVGMQAEIRDGYWACFDTAEPGPKLVELIDARLTASAAR